MKKIIFTLLSLSFFIAVQAQKTLPEIKVGTVMSASAFVQGQEFPLMITVKSLTAPVTLVWSVDGYGDGAFEIMKKRCKAEQPCLWANQEWVLLN